jgi:hypothetical protein
MLIKMKRAQNRNEDLPPREDLPVRQAERSDELLNRVLADDFCEFGSSEVIGIAVQRRFVG